VNKTEQLAGETTMSKINKIHDGTNEHPLDKHLKVNLTELDATSDISSTGSVDTAYALVTCTVTRNFTSASNNGMAWTRVIFCQADNTKTWTAYVGPLPPGSYLISARTNAEDADCTEIKVKGSSVDITPPIAITNTIANATSITVTGTVL